MQAVEPSVLRANARQTWSLGNFDAVAMAGTTPAAARLVAFAGIRPGQKVLDLATGTGVVAITAARAGAHVTGLDITPELLDVARRHAELAGVADTKWVEGDAAALEFPDASFDVVLSQFGHMFAPDPDAAASEMLRVLKPGGRVAFSTWPRTSYPGHMFGMNAKYGPPPPGPSPMEWGDRATVEQRLGPRVRDLEFQEATFFANTMSPRHYRTFFETTFGPSIKLSKALQAEPARLEAWRTEWEGIIARFFENNQVRHDFLMTRAVKA